MWYVLQRRVQEYLSIQVSQHWFSCHWFFHSMTIKPKNAKLSLRSNKKFIQYGDNRRSYKKSSTWPTCPRKNPSSFLNPLNSWILLVYIDFLSCLKVLLPAISCSFFQRIPFWLNCGMKMCRFFFTFEDVVPGDLYSAICTQHYKISGEVFEQFDFLDFDLSISHLWVTSTDSECLGPVLSVCCWRNSV